MEKVKIARYNVTVGDKRGDFGDAVERRRDGKWVRYDAHQRQHIHQQKRITDLQSKLDNSVDRVTCTNTQLRNALLIMGISAPESDEELGFKRNMYIAQIVRKLARESTEGNNDE